LENMYILMTFFYPRLAFLSVIKGKIKIEMPDLVAAISTLYCFIAIVNNVLEIASL